MVSSWSICGVTFNSPRSAVMGSLLKCRAARQKYVLRLRDEKRELQAELEQQQQQLQCEVDKANRLQSRLRDLQCQMQELRDQPLQLPEDPPVGTHGFGANMIALAGNVARRVGLRAAADVLVMVLEFLKVDANSPTWGSIRNWLMRIGIALVEEPVEPADDWIWMADHSNQIGPEKVLVIMGIRASQLPPRGTPLTHADLRVL